MQKSKIEWTDYTINPVKGLCPMACPYCYARAMYKRFHWPERLEYVLGWEFELSKIKKPSRIFVGSTMELFGPWIPTEILLKIFSVVRQYPQHTFIFLTKQPAQLHNFSPFPDNCWVGVSATNWMQFSNALGYLARIHARVRFLSFEPLLEQIEMDMLQKMLFPRIINWVIIGQQTPIKAATTPKIEWIHEMVTAADKVGIPVFLKNNLRSLLPEGEIPFYWLCDEDPMLTVLLRQEMPR